MENTSDAWVKQEAVEKMRRPFDWRLAWNRSEGGFMVVRELRGDVEVFARGIVMVSDALSVLEVAANRHVLACESCGNPAARFEHGGYYCPDCAVGGA